MSLRRNLISAVFGGATWTPDKLSGLLLWLKADTITGVADGAALGQWNDLSGNANHCTQATEANKPIYSTGIDGRPEVAMSYIDLTGAKTRWMTIPNGVSFNEQNASIVWVGRPVSQTLCAGYGVPVCVSTTKLGWGPLNTALVVSGTTLRDGTNRVFHQTGMTACSLSGSAAKAWYNESVDTYAAGANATRTGGRIGTDTAGAFRAYGTLSEVLIYNRTLTDSEVAKIYSYCRQKYGIVSSPTKQIVFDGDSLTTGYGCLNNLNYPMQVGKLLGGDWKIYNVGEAGQTLQAMQADAAVEVDPVYDAGLSKNVLVCWGGLLDINAGVTVADTLTRMETYCAARQAAGWRVVVLTVLPSNYISEENRAALNTGIRNNYASWADALADIAADTRIGDTGDNDDATYYNNSDTNKTHMTQAGFAIVAGIVKAAINGLP